MHPHDTPVPTSHDRVCAHCGKPFWVRWAKSTQAYCSYECRGLAMRIATPQPCAQCGKEFTPRPRNTRAGLGQYCSKSCSNAARAKPIEERFWALIEKPNGDACPWLWAAAKDSDGYGLFTTHPGLQERAHRVAYRLANGALDPGVDVLHRCDIRACCRPDCLFTGTVAVNMADRNAKGRQARGESSGLAKLTEDDIRSIRTRYGSGHVSQQSLAAEYGVHQVTISDIIRGRTWTNIAVPDN